MARIRGPSAARLNECFDSWAAWRSACATVDLAYRHWTTARTVERAFAFARYRAALADEEARAHAFASLVGSGLPASRAA